MCWPRADDREQGRWRQRLVFQQQQKAFPDLVLAAGLAIPSAFMWPGRAGHGTLLSSRSCWRAACTPSTQHSPAAKPPWVCTGLGSGTPGLAPGGKGSEKRLISCCPRLQSSREVRLPSSRPEDGGPGCRSTSQQRGREEAHPPSPPLSPSFPLGASL